MQSFKLVDQSWNHLNVKRLFKGSDMYIYNNNLLLKKINDKYRIRVYFNEEGYCDSIQEIIFDHVLSTTICEDEDIYKLTIEFVNFGVIKTLKFNRLTYEHANSINDFVMNYNIC